jgi:hypothetical protein
MNASQKPVPQVALEVMMKRNKEEADKLLKSAKDLLAENRKIETEMRNILASAAPPASAVASIPPPSAVPLSSMRPDPMGGLLHAADALVRSWKRRNKKNFKQLELDLMAALEKTNG